MNSTAPQDGNQGPTVIGVAVLLIILTSISTILRFWSRAVTDSRFWWDDWLTFAALPAFIGNASLVIVWVNIAGLGQHASSLTPEQSVLQYKLLFVYYWLYNFGLTLPKLSVLFFYARVFESYHARWLKIALWTTGGLVILRLLEGIVTSLTQCFPIEKIWDSSVPGHCIDENQSYIVSGVLDAVPDVMILVLPLPIVWNLPSKLSRKIAMTALFACGSSVVAISILAVIYVASQGSSWWTDFSWNVVPRVYITILEPSISIIGVCLPTILILVRRARMYGLAKLFTVKLDIEDHYESRSDPFTTGSRVGRFERLRTPSVELQKPDHV